MNLRLEINLAHTMRSCLKEEEGEEEEEEEEGNGGRGSGTPGLMLGRSWGQGSHKSQHMRDSKPQSKWCWLRNLTQVPG